MEYQGITINLERDSLFDELGLKRLQESYMMEGETSPQQRYAYVSSKFGSNKEHSQRLYDYSSKHWLSYATPELAYGRNKKGMPISCFLSYLDDSAKGLIDTLSEVNTLSMLGGGVGVHMNIRSADEKSTGIIPHLKTYDASSLAYKQGSTRRGSYAVYLDINHPDIIPFIEMRKATGDPNARCLNLHHGVNITDGFMQIIEKCMIDPEFDDSWDLIDPASKKVVSTVSAKHLWEQIIETRTQRGEPYLHFIDTANRALPIFQKEKGLKINGSNLCVTGDTIIEIKETDAGEPVSLKISEFTRRFSTGYYNDPYVKSYLNGDIVWAKVSNAAQTDKVSQLYEINTPSGNKLKCTGNHKIYTRNRGYVEASELTNDDELLILGNISSCTVEQKTLTYNASVYDITVPETECFFANDILIHNCIEIELSTSKERTAVCCLASLNLDYYDEWKDDYQFHKDVAEMLDNVLTIFIETSPDEIKRAKFSAQQERSIGIGVMGFHSYLQQKNIPFECAFAKSTNMRIFNNVKNHLDKANSELAIERGECPDANGYGKRFSHLMAVAPNACVTADTKIRLSNDSIIDYESLINTMGINYNSLLDYELLLDDGTTKVLKYNDIVSVNRDGKTIKILACGLMENDELV